MTHAKFHFNQLTLTLIFGICATEPPSPPPPSPRAWRTTEKAGPDRVKAVDRQDKINIVNEVSSSMTFYRRGDFVTDDRFEFFRTPTPEPLGSHFAKICS